MPERWERAVRDWNYPRGVASIAVLVAAGLDEGIPASTLLAGTALTAADLADPDRQVEAATELAVVRALVSATRDPIALGLRVGDRYRITTFGLFGFACVSSPTLRAAIDFALAHLDLTFAFCLPVPHVSGDRIVVDLDTRDIPEDVRDFLIARDLTAVVAILDDMLGMPVRLRAVSFEGPATARHDALLTARFGCAPTSGADRTWFAVDAALLDRALPAADSDTVRLCVEQCRAIVAQRRASVGPAAEIRDVLVWWTGRQTWRAWRAHSARACARCGVVSRTRGRRSARSATTCSRRGPANSWAPAR